jgi:multidrug efflux system membrane fusion protein
MGDQDALASLENWQSQVDNVTEITNMAHIEDVLFSGDTSGGSLANGAVTAGLK